jgi:hypothetical protein
MKNMLALALIAVVASGCASGLSRSRGDQELARYEPYVGEPIDGFTAFRQQSWQPVSRNQLILWTTINDAYLLTITNNCPNLEFSSSIGVSSTANRVSRLDHVTVRGDRCLIQKIQPIDMRAFRRDREARENAQASS